KQLDPAAVGDLAEVVNADQIWMIELARDARFVHEALNHLVDASKCRLDQLDGNLATERSLHGSVDAAHTAMLDRSEDLVAVGDRTPHHRIGVLLDGLLRTARRAERSHTPRVTAHSACRRHDASREPSILHARRCASLSKTTFGSPWTR